MNSMEEIQGMIHRLMLIGECLKGEDLGAFIEGCRHSEAFSCFLVSPIEYQAGAGRMRAMIEYAESLQQAQREYARVVTEFEQSEALARKCRETNPEIPTTTIAGE